MHSNLKPHHKQSEMQLLFIDLLVDLLFSVITGCFRCPGFASEDGDVDLDHYNQMFFCCINVLASAEECCSVRLAVKMTLLYYIYLKNRAW